MWYPNNQTLSKPSTTFYPCMIILCPIYDWIPNEESELSKSDDCSNCHNDNFHPKIRGCSITAALIWHPTHTAYIFAVAKGDALTWKRHGGGNSYVVITAAFASGIASITINRYCFIGSMTREVRACILSTFVSTISITDIIVFHCSLRDPLCYVAILFADVWARAVTPWTVILRTFILGLG